MRTFMFATLFALGLGIVATATTSAAPINYTPLPGASENTNLVQKIYWDRWGRWCSRRCSYRRCWVICR